MKKLSLVLALVILFAGSSLASHRVLLIKQNNSPGTGSQKTTTTTTKTDKKTTKTEKKTTTKTEKKASVDKK